MSTIAPPMKTYAELIALREGGTVSVNGEQYRMVSGKESGSKLALGDLCFGQNEADGQVSTVCAIRANGIYLNDSIGAYILGDVAGVVKV